jgi:hypothetical protein
MFVNISVMNGGSFETVVKSSWRSLAAIDPHW